MVVILLLSLNQMVNQAFGLDTAQVQADKTMWLLTEITRDLNTTFKSSPQNILKESIDSYLALERTMIAQENYGLTVTYSVTTRIVDIELRSENAYLKKTVNFTP